MMGLSLTPVAAGVSDLSQGALAAIGISVVALVGAGAAVYLVREQQSEPQTADASPDVKQAVSQLATKVEELERDVAVLEDKLESQSGEADGATEQSPPEPEPEPEPDETQEPAGEPETSRIVDDEDEGDSPGINKIDIDDEF